MVARPSASREATRNTKILSDVNFPIKPSEEEIKTDKESENVFGLIAPQVKMSQNTKSISQSVRVAPQSFVSTQTVG